ncbi:hypothetical protein E3N88_40328 [Mikania micrantha]|uniref:DUF4005 domain-containing protein n=1 Tax=Mikania micrantha TaxID=192012 RepID=A0A5N6LN65_9ASTR|nr:hypothetical protein E3N88_40328 [Mikania micrantha]
MGRSTKSCFKIISCGCINESVDRDEIDVSSENKGSNKAGWSFRNKSPTRQEPINTVITEKIPSSENKEIPEPITINYEPQINSNISEKTSDNIWTEEMPDSITKNATVSTMATKPACEEVDTKCETEPDDSESESAILVIQAAVRRFLAERRLIKHKNVVKLQAAVRGHLVRSHAVGTLRCVQAIVKMQALVRARREKGGQNTGISSTPTYISIEKLLSNRLARQLMESTPKTKQINIKCDPSKSDSAWNWLERWMSVSSPETLESHTSNHDQDKDVNKTETEVKIVNFANNVEEATVRFEEKENLIDIEENSCVISHEEEPIHVSTPENSVLDTKTEPIPKNLVLETKPDPILENRVLESEPKHTDSEGRNYVFGSRKASNPAFIAAQSRFEELTSPKTYPLKSLNSSNQDYEPGSGSGSGSGSQAENSASDPLKSAKPSNQDDVAESGLPADISLSDFLKPENEVIPCVDIGPSAPSKATEPVDSLVNHGSLMVQNGGSECGTELSITSTLDSPDQVETENKKFNETKILNEAVGDMSNNIEIVMPEEQVDQKPENSDIDLEPESNHHVNKSNDHEPLVQSESPRSHITTLESQGTPSSQISTTTKKTKTVKKVSGQKPTSWSTSKKSSPISSSVDSGLRSSLEQFPKDPKPLKRRISSGSPKPDHIDHEPSVPSYMQATESARAKAVANSSPRSSPDVHDIETYSKKRHSLPGAVNGRQGSPRVRRSMSQALQTTKGNGSQGNP